MQGVRPSLAIAVGRICQRSFPLACFPSLQTPYPSKWTPAIGWLAGSTLGRLPREVRRVRAKLIGKWSSGPCKIRCARRFHNGRFHHQSSGIIRDSPRRVTGLQSFPRASRNWSGSVTAEPSAGSDCRQRVTFCSRRTATPHTDYCLFDRKRRTRSAISSAAVSRAKCPASRT